MVWQIGRGKHRADVGLRHVLFRDVFFAVQESDVQEKQNVRLVQTRQAYRLLRRLPGN